ncbi:hypothetical protein LINPERHAP2_LOCUS27218 [Linum perenne]
MQPHGGTKRERGPLLVGEEERLASWRLIEARRRLIPAALLRISSDEELFNQPSSQPKDGTVRDLRWLVFQLQTTQTGISRIMANKRETRGKRGRLTISMLSSKIRIKGNKES